MESLGFYTLTIYLHTSLALPPQSSASAAEPLHGHLARWSHQSSSALLPKRLAVHGSCCASQCAFTWAPLVQGWQFMASLHSHPEQNLIWNCSVHTELPTPKVLLNNLLIKQKLYNAIRSPTCLKQTCFYQTSNTVASKKDPLSQPKSRKKTPKKPQPQNKTKPVQS